MITVQLSRAQAAGLLELADRAAESGTPPQGMGGKRFIAANRGIERLRDALDGHEPDELQVELDAIADGLDTLHDPDQLVQFRTRLRDLGAAMKLVTDVERVRRTALNAGHGLAVRQADRALEKAREQHPSWRALAADLIAACADGLPDDFGPLSGDVYDLFELDVFELSLRSLRERGWQ